MDGGQNPTRNRRPDGGLAAAFVLVAVLLWGFSPIGTRFLVGNTDADLPAMAILALRYGGAALLLAPLLGRRKVPWSRQDWVLALICGGLGITVYNILAIYGQRTISAGMTGLLDAAEPLLILLFSAIALRELPSGRVLAAAGGGAIGVGLLAVGAGPAQGDLRGIMLVLASAVAWAGYCVIVPRLIIRRGPLKVTAVTMLLGTLPLMAAGAPSIPATVHAMNTPDIVVLAALAVGSSALATLLWNAGSAGIGAVQASWFLYLIPLISLTGGVLLLGEPVNPAEIVGGAIVLISVALAQTRERIKIEI